MRAAARAADRARAERRAAEADRDRRTPWVVPVMKWGGLALGSVGLLTATATYFSYNSTSTKEPEFQSLQAWNTAGWIAAGFGAGAFALSFALLPSVNSAKAGTSLRVGPGAVAWVGTF
jgi:hypothetical protein